MYHLAKELCNKGVDVSIFAFQNKAPVPEHSFERALPDSVEVYDAFLYDKDDTEGFGVNIIAEYINRKAPDVVVIYNDLIITSKLLRALEKGAESMPDLKKITVVPYLDIVYKNMNMNMLEYIFKRSRDVIVFSNIWKTCLEDCMHDNDTVRLHVLPHGVSQDNVFPVDKVVARKYFGISPDDFVILNLNRNQPRKRLDVMIKAFVEFMTTRLGQQIKIVVGTEIRGHWNIDDLLRSEANYRKISFDELRKHVVFVETPQMMSDYDVNVLYNVADVGINTCDGEGFGLCNFEQASVGVPQIVSDVGGLRDIFQASDSIKITPITSLYNASNTVGGEAEICSSADFNVAMAIYYENKALVAMHGSMAMKRILRDFKWDDIADKMIDILNTSIKIDAPIIPENIDIEKMARLKKKIIILTDDDVIDSPVPYPAPAPTEVPVVPVPAEVVPVPVPVTGTLPVLTPVPIVDTYANTIVFKNLNSIGVNPEAPSPRHIPIPETILPVVPSQIDFQGLNMQALLELSEKLSAVLAMVGKIGVPE
jgi:glycosyltransferase involved in cell wall biosynthesis